VLGSVADNAHSLTPQFASLKAGCLTGGANSIKVANRSLLTTNPIRFIFHSISRDTVSISTIIRYSEAHIFCETYEKLPDM
jgi:hypothetical protein